MAITWRADQQKLVSLLQVWTTCDTRWTEGGQTPPKDRQMLSGRVKAFSYCFFLLLLLEMGSHYVAQTGLKPLDSSDRPASASRVADPPGACHHHVSGLLLKGFYVIKSGPLKKISLLIKQK